MAIRAEDIDLGRDRLLVEAWQAGDPAAFDDLYRRYFDRLRAFCERRVGSRADAEEIAQEAMVKALQALDRLEGERRFYPWVSVIANRLCIDHHRRLARVRPSDDVDPGSVDDDTPARLALQDDIDNLDRALQRLGPRHAEVLELRERRGMSYHEIAAHLGVPHSTVEALLFRARRALRKEFAAVSGERLAAFPLVGWLALKVDRLRDRLGDLGAASVLGAPLAAGAAAAVIGLGGVGGGPAPSTPVTTLDRPAAAVVAEPLTPVTTAAPSAPASASRAAGAAPSGGQASPSGTLRAAGVHVADQDTTRRESADMPVLVDAGEVGAALDPRPLVAPVVDRLLPGGNR